VMDGLCVYRTPRPPVSPHFPGCEIVCFRFRLRFHCEGISAFCVILMARFQDSLRRCGVPRYSCESRPAFLGSAPQHLHSVSHIYGRVKSSDSLHALARIANTVSSIPALSGLRGGFSRVQTKPLKCWELSLLHKLLHRDSTCSLCN
jgi:hypothetical protein